LSIPSSWVVVLGSVVFLKGLRKKLAKSVEAQAEYNDYSARRICRRFWTVFSQAFQKNYKTVFFA
jgi:hypothetical protein